MSWTLVAQIAVLAVIALVAVVVVSAVWIAAKKTPNKKQLKVTGRTAGNDDD